MAFYRSPWYHFNDTTETGIDQIPPNGKVFIESTGTTYLKDNDTGITPTSTIQNAIDGGNILTDGLKADGTIPMSVGYIPVNDQDIATKVSVEDKIGSNLLFDNGVFGGE